MQIQLLDLLRSREIVHPSRIVRIESACDSSCSLELVGYPWWCDLIPTTDEQKAVIRLEGIQDGNLDVVLLESGPSDDDLENFDVQPLNSYSWASGIYQQLFCSTPIEDPIKIYATLHDYLISVQCLYSPHQYLNMGDVGTFQFFEDICRSNSFQLCAGPDSICKAVADEIDKEGATYTFVDGRRLESPDILVSIKDSQITCSNAFITFDN